MATDQDSQGGEPAPEHNVYWRLAGAGLVLVAVLAFVVSLDRPSVRYAEFPGQCRLIYRQEGPVDLVAMGSSRSMRAFQAPLLAKRVEELHGYRPIIHDLSRAYRDIGHMYVFLRDYLAHHDVKTLLVEVKETGSQWRHPYYERTATIGDIVGASQARPSVPLITRVQAIVRNIVDRTVYRLNQMIDGKLHDRCFGRSVQASRTTDYSKPHFVNSEQLSQQMKRGGDWDTKPNFTFAFDAPEEERNIYFIKAVKALADSHGSNIVFYYVPRLLDRPVDAAFKAEFEKRFGARLISLPESTLRSIYPAGYTDPTHMGWGGAEAYMTHLARNLPWAKRASQ